MDVRPAQCVADALVGIEVRIEDLTLFCGRYFGESLGRRIGERTTDADYRLGPLGGIDEDADLCLERLTHLLEGQLVGRTEAVVGFVGGGVDRYRSSLDVAVELWGLCVVRRRSKRRQR